MAASPKLQSASSVASLPDMVDGWQRVCRRLRSELGEDVFSSWFARIELEQIAGGQALLSVPTKFLKSWLQSHYNDKLLANIAGEWPDVAGLAIRLRNGRSGQPQLTLLPAGIVIGDTVVKGPEPSFAAPAQAAGFAETPAARFLAAATASRSAPEGASENISGSPLDRRLTFASFLVGRSNQLAHAAAQQVAQARAGDVPT